MHAISGCDTVSCPFNRGKISALNILKAGECTGLYEVLGEENATDAELMETGRRFFTAIYGQPGVQSLHLGQSNYGLTLNKLQQKLFQFIFTCINSENIP